MKELIFVFFLQLKRTMSPFKNSSMAWWWRIVFIQSGRPEFVNLQGDHDLAYMYNNGLSCSILTWNTILLSLQKGSFSCITKEVSEVTAITSNQSILFHYTCDVAILKISVNHYFLCAYELLSMPIVHIWQF